MNSPTKRIKVGNIVLCEWFNEAIVGGTKMLLPNITISRVYFSQKKKVFEFGNQFNPKDLQNIIDVIARYEAEVGGELLNKNI